MSAELESTFVSGLTLMHCVHGLLTNAKVVPPYVLCQWYLGG